MNYNANTFSLASDQCYRFVQVHGTGHAGGCPNEPAWHGRFRDEAGTLDNVVSCDGHRGDIEEVRPLAIVSAT